MPLNQASPPPQSNPKQQAIERLRQANTVLVTVSANPTVDQLAACIGTTLFLNRAGKHATAVFSGKVPSTLEFLQPEKTLEQTTDSLQDFIISLDKSKADKLRYKVEDDVVRIFITPYKAALSQNDLEFSQGDFNVEVVLALGVQKREDLDKVILAHGRILHDATVISVTKGEQHSELGSINWHEPGVSSLCEVAVGLSVGLQQGIPEPIIDNQTATALLTGIVAETERFSNQKTTPQVMSLSAQLMSAGANQQLIANKLSQQVEADIKPKPKPPKPQYQAQAVIDDSHLTEKEKPNDGTLTIDHSEDNEILIDDETGRLERLRLEKEEEERRAAEEQQVPNILPQPAEPEPETEVNPPEEPPTPPETPPAEQGGNEQAPSEDDKPNEPVKPPEEPEVKGHSLLKDDGADANLTANTVPEHDLFEPTSDPFSAGRNRDKPILSHGTRDHHKVIDPPPEDHKLEEALAIEEGLKLPPEATPVTEPKPAGDSVADIENLIGSSNQSEPPVNNTPPPVDDARAAVAQATQDQPDTTPIKALNAAPLDSNLNSAPPADNNAEAQQSATPQVLDSTAPPPVPPPMMPQFFDPSGQVDNPYLNPDNPQK